MKLKKKNNTQLDTMLKYPSHKKKNKKTKNCIRFFRKAFEKIMSLVEKG